MAHVVRYQRRTSRVGFSVHSGWDCVLFPEQCRIHPAHPAFEFVILHLSSPARRPHGQFLSLNVTSTRHFALRLSIFAVCCAWATEVRTDVDPARMAQRPPTTLSPAGRRRWHGPLREPVSRSEKFLAAGEGLRARMRAAGRISVLSQCVCGKRRRGMRAYLRSGQGAETDMACLSFDGPSGLVRPTLRRPAARRRRPPPDRHRRSALPKKR